MTLTEWLQILEYDFRNGSREEIVYGPNKVEKHGVIHNLVDDEGAGYAVVGYNLPDGVYAEIDDNTYGSLQGFRIYYGTEY